MNTHSTEAPKSVTDIDKALASLNELVRTGMEFPDASFRVAFNSKCGQTDLEKVYDAQFEVTPCSSPPTGYATKYHFNIMVDSKIIKQEPIVGAWYVHYESVINLSDGKYTERDGNIGRYKGCGQFCDEDGSDISMVGDVYSPWVDYLVLQS